LVIAPKLCRIVRRIAVNKTTELCAGAIPQLVGHDELLEYLASRCRVGNTSFGSFTLLVYGFERQLG
jgi:hypothetical protein